MRVESSAAQHLQPEGQVLHLVEARHKGQFRTHVRGEFLYCQGSPAQEVYVLRRGKVKLCCTSCQGKTLTYQILGPNHLLGAVAMLLGEVHEATAEILEDSEVYALTSREFHELLSDPAFSIAALQQLARWAQGLALKVQNLTFLDVEGRLRSALVGMAGQHGRVQKDGVRIDLDLTHEGLAEMVAANRSTVTSGLNRLKAQGYLWQQGRRLVILPPEQIEILDNLGRAVSEGNDAGAVQWATRAVAEKIDPWKTLEALTEAIRQVDRSFVREDLALPDLVMAAFAMKSAMPVVQQGFVNMGQEQTGVGTVVVGTVQGDIHDIGKTMVSMFLVANNFRVIDLGVDVKAEAFLQAVQQFQPDVLALSALMTFTAPEIRTILQGLERENLRHRLGVIVGGGAISGDLAARMGADGYHATARGAVDLAWQILTKAKENRHPPR
ncbi:MAG TPA: cobalamin-dependent protein [Anaerolineae bacterium]|nr:cobalamin-dependent protein [Anaerolineae bacterium]